MHYAGILPGPVRLPNWDPILPDGELHAILLHWTGSTYERVFPAYHFCLSGADAVVVHATHDLRANMRNVRAESDRPYAAHTAGRNSYAAGIAVCGMLAATPFDFGPAPLTRAQVEGAIAVCARLVRRYGIPIGAVRTHAEAALEDGYFGSGPDERWDIARLEPRPQPLETHEATAVGAWFRERIAAAS